MSWSNRLRWNPLWLFYPQYGGLREMVGGARGVLMTGGALRDGKLASSSDANGGVYFSAHERLKSITDKYTILVYANPSSLGTYATLLSIAADNTWVSPYGRIIFGRDTATSSLRSFWYNSTASDIKTVSSSSGAIATTDGPSLYALTMSAGAARFWRGATAYGTGSNGDGLIGWNTLYFITLMNRHGTDPDEGMSGDLTMAAIFPYVLDDGIIQMLSRDPSLIVRPPAPVLVQTPASPPPPPPPAPVAIASASPTSGFASLSVAFSDDSTGEVTTRLWDFDGDGGTDSTDENPTHIYTTPGVYNARLYVANSGGSDEDFKVITVFSPPPPPPPGTGIPQVSYSVELDLNRNGAFDHAQREISARVDGMNWSLGMSEAYEAFASPSRLQLTLDNADGALNPDDDDATFYGLLVRGVLVRVRATYNSETRQLWIGKVAKIGAVPGEWSNDGGEWKKARIVAEDPLPRLYASDYTPKLRQNLRADEALQAVFDEATMPYPYDSSFFMIEYSAIGEARIFINEFTAFEEARTTLQWVGDTSEKGRGTRARNYMETLIDAEAGGRFFWDGRAGKFAFHSRYHDVLSALVETFDAGDIDGVQAAFGEDIANVVTVTYEPRTLGTPGSILWTQSEPTTLRALEEKTITARFTDSSEKNARVAAVDIITPLLVGTDYVATYADGSSADVGVTIEVSAPSAKITLVNPRSLEVTFSLLQVRGTPLTTYKREEVTEMDVQSIGAYDRAPRAIALPAVDNAEFARDVARATLARFKQPLARWRSASFELRKSHKMTAAGLKRTVGERVRLQEPWSEHDAEYVIVGEQHQVDVMSKKHLVTWVVKPTGRERWFTIENAERGQLDGDAVLAL